MCIGSVDSAGGPLPLEIENDVRESISLQNIMVDGKCTRRDGAGFSCCSDFVVTRRLQQRKSLRARRCVPTGQPGLQA